MGKCSAEQNRPNENDDGVMQTRTGVLQKKKTDLFGLMGVVMVTQNKTHKCVGVFDRNTNKLSSIVRRMCARNYEFVSTGHVFVDR